MFGVPISPGLVSLHLLLLVGGALLIGMRVYGATHARPDADALQLQRLAKAASVGMFLLLLALLVAADFGLIRIAGMMQ